MVEKDVGERSESGLFEQVASEVEMDPPDLAGVTRVGSENGIDFLQ